MEYGYDPLGRFHSITSSVASSQSVVQYSYLQGSDILAGWSSNHGTSHTRTFEPNRNLITTVENRHGTNLISSFAYTNDEIGHRTARIDNHPASTATNEFGYNVRSELISAGMNTNLYSYLYDPIRLRCRACCPCGFSVSWVHSPKMDGFSTTRATAGQVGNRQEAVVNAATNSYTANALNQYLALHSLGDGGTSISNGVTVEPTYDDDGNMLSHGDWTYTWNGENRLILASNAQHVVEYAYDHIGRMVVKTSNGETIRYLWDGYNIIAEIKTTNEEPGTTNVTYNVWGLDLSGTMQGAGGVSGLLAVSRGSQKFTAAYDANGNVTEYVNAEGNIAANRAYGPFGETTGTSGAADTFTHWWSTKPWDEATGFSEYEYRKYFLELGRWLNRDPLNEKGGSNLYLFVLNFPLNSWDLLGLQAATSCITGRELDSHSAYHGFPGSPHLPTGWTDAILSDFLDWVAGQVNSVHYNENNFRTQNLRRSEIGVSLVHGFIFKNRNYVSCSEWEDFTNVVLKFDIRKFLTDLPNGTAHFVGSARGDAIIEAQTSREVAVRFTLTNTTSLKSFLYHLIPDSWNITTPGIPLSNWTQTYTWTEKFICCGNCVREVPNT